MICKWCHTDVTPLDDGRCPNCWAEFVEAEKPKKTSKKIKQEETKDGE